LWLDLFLVPQVGHSTFVRVVSAFVTGWPSTSPTSRSTIVWVTPLLKKGEAVWKRWSLMLPGTVIPVAAMVVKVSGSEVAFCPLITEVLHQISRG
jgi:hypothetical protein